LNCKDGIFTINPIFIVNRVHSTGINSIFQNGYYKEINLATNESKDKTDHQEKGNQPE
jgi:hypothetical protein